MEKIRKPKPYASTVTVLSRSYGKIFMATGPMLSAEANHTLYNPYINFEIVEREWMPNSFYVIGDDKLPATWKAINDYIEEHAGRWMNADEVDTYLSNPARITESRLYRGLHKESV